MYSSEPMLSSNDINVHITDHCIDHCIDHNLKFDELQHHMTPPDPRVQIELENLNTSTDLINKLEVELNDSRNHFRVLLTDSSQRIAEMSNRLGRCVERAKPYYEARVKVKELQSDTQKAAFRFERASSAHMAAKEMVRLAEEGLQKDGNIFDSSWQEVLNHSTIRVNECERERVMSEQQHQKTSQAYNNSEQLVIQLHKQLKRSIVKARPYFEMKAQFNQMLDEQISKVRSYEQRVTKAKLNYSKALQRLEEISDEIHQKRKGYNYYLSESRGVGVGEESPIPSSPKLTKALRKLSLESSQDLTQMHINWFHKNGIKSATNSERDDCESVADSVGTNDTLDIDDSVIDNLMLTQNLEFNEFSDFDVNSDKTTFL